MKSCLSAHCLFSLMSDGLMVTALAQDQAPDVGQAWTHGWVSGRGRGSGCSNPAELFPPHSFWFAAVNGADVTAADSSKLRGCAET